MFALLVAWSGSLLTAAPLGTAFSYQGQLADVGQPANGIYDLRFAVFDAAIDGTPVGGPLTNAAVVVSNGLFACTLDFGEGVFTGDARWLEIALRPQAGGEFTLLSPRQPLVAVPYAAYATQAKLAETAATASSVAADSVSTAAIQEASLTAAKIASGQVVKSLNGRTDAVTLEPGANVRVDYLGNSLQIGAAADGTLRLEGNEAGGTGGRIVFGPWPSLDTWIGETVDHEILLITQSGVGVGPGNLGIRLNSLADATHALTVGGDILARPTDGFNPDTSATLFLGDDYNYLKSVWGGGLRLGVWQGEDSLTVRNGGWVGISTTDPQQRLDVALGDVILRGPDNFAGPGSPATLFLGDAVHYVRATREFGLTLGTWPVGDALCIREPNGWVGLGTSAPQTRLDVVGTTRTEVLEITGGADLAEPFQVTGVEAVSPGAVLVIDDRHPGRLRLADRACDRRVAGVVSGAGGLNAGLTLSQPGLADQGVPVALSGRVYALADAAFGAISPGDLLTTSNTPGHAMKVGAHADAQGAILGKAMSALPSGQGLVLVLVTLQ